VRGGRLDEAPGGTAISVGERKKGGTAAYGLRLSRQEGVGGQLCTAMIVWRPRRGWGWLSKGAGRGMTGSSLRWGGGGKRVYSR